MAEAACFEGSETGDNRKAFERFCSTVSAATFMSSGTDEEYDLLPLPELDEDFLDGDMYGQDDNAREVPRCVSFASIHNVPLPFASTRRHCYMPGQRVYVVVAEVEHVERGRLLSPNLYVIHISHGDYKWTIRRRYKHFRQLHEQLLLYRAKLKIPIPSRDHREQRRRFCQRPQTLPHLPRRPEALVRPEHMDKRMQRLELYLQNVLRCPEFRNHPETLKFLEVSHLSFVNNLGGKWKEGFVLKRSGGRRAGLGVIGGIKDVVKWMAVWSRRWLLVKDTFIAYIRPSDGVVADVVLMDRDFRIKIGRKDTGINNGLLISNLTRYLSIKCSTVNQTHEWQRSINEAAGSTGSEFTTPNRHKSFAPERDNSFASWFQDAASYMSAAADAMDAAREEIFITDWWLSPEVYMKRPTTEGHHWRLDKILERKAEAGVKVFVLLFKEMEFTIGLNSYYSKQVLIKMHPNIKVLRHPDGFSLWSHHEKCIVVDQRIAFLGGIDLCYGRWDMPSHRLTDLGSVMHNQDASGASSVQAEVHHDDNDSPEGMTGDQGNISKTLWRKMSEPHHRPTHHRPLSSISAFLSLNLIAPMISVPRAASSETHLFVASKAVIPVKRASDSDLIKKHGSDGVKSNADGVAVGNGFVSYVSESVNRNCISSEDVNISLQTTDVVVNNVQIVIESTDDVDDSSSTLEHPVRLNGMDDAEIAIQTVHVSVATSTASTGSSNLSLYIDNRRKHVDNIPSTKVRPCSVCTESEHCNNVMNNNNKIVSSDDCHCQELIPCVDTDHYNGIVSNDKRHVDGDRSQSEPPKVTNTCCVAANQKSHSSSVGDTASDPCQKQEPLINPHVAERLLELFSNVKSHRAKAKMSSDQVAVDSIDSTSPQHRRVPEVRVTRCTPEEKQNSGKISQNKVMADDGQEAYQKHCISRDAEVNVGPTNGWPAPGEYHCISLDLCNGHSRHDSRLPSNADEEHSSSSVQSQQKETSGSSSRFNSPKEQRLHQNGSSSKHAMEENNSRAVQTLRSNNSRTELALGANESVTEQTLEPSESRTVQILGRNDSVTEQTLQTNDSSGAQTLEPKGSKIVQTVEPNKSIKGQAVEPNHSRTERTLRRQDSISQQSLEHDNPSTESSPTRLSDYVFEPQLDLLTVDHPDLRMSMLRSMLETPSVVHRRPHNDSWSRDKRLSCFVGEGEPLLLRNYLECVGDVIDGGEDEDSVTVEPEPQTVVSSCEEVILVKTPVNKKGFWRLRGRGMSLDIKAAAIRARRTQENHLRETGALYIMSMETATPKPSTPPATRRPTFFQKARMIQHIKGKFAKSPRVVENTAVLRELLDNRSLFNETHSPGTALTEMGLEGDTKLWIGKDYTNFIVKDFVDLEEPFTDFIDRRVTPRMPWHDIGAVVYGKPARDVGRHFIQRWNFAKLQKRKTSSDYPLLLPKSYRRVTLTENVTRGATSCNCQILRSASQWSAGISHVEDSIHQAYVEQINNAKYFIYIENQFFVSTCDEYTENGIAEALYRRIMKAHSESKVFRVYVVMPLLPAFEGELGRSSGAPIQVVMHWNYLSISRGGKSLLERLAAKISDPFEYISFYGLRTHSELVGNLTTELIYVHSKMMIVDDVSVIIGSANINDRSLIGKRDSELAVVIEDTKMFPSRFNGQSCMVGQYASSLRRSLFREHLGLLSGKSTVDVSDPVSSAFYKGIWMKRATINTSMYEKVFNCIPSDQIHDFHELRQRQKLEPFSQTSPIESRRLLARVKGHLVLLPLQFLCREHLPPAIGFGTKEALVPTVIWT